MQVGIYFNPGGSIIRSFFSKNRFPKGTKEIKAYFKSLVSWSVDRATKTISKTKKIVTRKWSL